MTEVLLAEIDILKKKCEKYEQAIEDIKAEFASLYPKNYAGEFELGGASCEFSLNKVYEIIDQHIGDTKC